MPGDERWPSWTPTASFVFSQRIAEGNVAAGIGNADGKRRTHALTRGDGSAWQGTRFAGRQARSRTSRIAIPKPATRPTSGCAICARLAKDRRVTRAPGAESYPAWAPDNTRVAYAAADGSGASAAGLRSAVRHAAAPADGPAGPAAGRGAATWSRSWRWRRRSGRACRDSRVAPPRRAGVVARRTDAAHRDVRDVERRLQRQSESQRQRPADRDGAARTSSRCGACWRRAPSTRRRRSSPCPPPTRALDVGVRSGLADAEVDVLHERVRRRRRGTRCARSTARAWRR